MRRVHLVQFMLSWLLYCQSNIMAHPVKYNSEKLLLLITHLEALYNGIL